MYVCICQGVTDRQIREAVGEGCGSMRELRQQLGVAATCGRCATYAKQMLDETLAVASEGELAAA